MDLFLKKVSQNLISKYLIKKGMSMYGSLLIAKLSQVPAKLDWDSFIITIPVVRPPASASGRNSFKTDFWTTKEAEIGNGTIIQPS